MIRNASNSSRCFNVGLGAAVRFADDGTLHADFRFETLARRKRAPQHVHALQRTQELGSQRHGIQSHIHRLGQGVVSQGGEGNRDFAAVQMAA